MIRDVILDLCPPWLRNGRAGRYMYDIGLTLDLILLKVEQGMHLRMPTVCDESALPAIGRDLLMRRGPNETTPSYRTRLQKGPDTWAKAAGVAEVLRQALIACPTKPRARHIAARYERPLEASIPFGIEDTKWDTYEANADTGPEPTRTLVEPGNWDWDSVSEGRGSWAWSRFWLVMESVGDDAWCAESSWKIGDAGAPKIGDRSWAIGFDTPCATFRRIFEAVMEFKAEGSRCAAIIVSFDATHFDPDQPAGGGLNPQGLHGKNGKIVGRKIVPARLITGARYLHRIQ
jgi:hypothetical protein